MIGIGALATVVPISSKTVKPGPLRERDKIQVEDMSIKSWKVEFNPNSEYGRAVFIDDHTLGFIGDRLHRDAKKVLSKGTPYELRLSIPGIQEYPELKSEAAAWYYSPLMLRDAPPKGMTSKSWQYIPEYGCYAMGRFYA